MDEANERETTRKSLLGGSLEGGGRRRGGLGRVIHAVVQAVEMVDWAVIGDVIRRVEEREGGRLQTSADWIEELA